MGRFKENIREGVKEIQENSEETIERGSEMTEKAEQINAELSDIEVQDEEDVEGLSSTKDSLQEAHDNAFEEQVETAAPWGRWGPPR